MPITSSMTAMNEVTFQKNKAVKSDDNDESQYKTSSAQNCRVLCTACVKNSR